MCVCVCVVCVIRWPNLLSRAEKGVQDEKREERAFSPTEAHSQKVVLVPYSKFLFFLPIFSTVFFIAFLCFRPFLQCYCPHTKAFHNFG